MFFPVMLGVTIYRRGKPQYLHFGVEAATCLRDATLLARSFRGDVSLSLWGVGDGATWFWHQFRPLRVPASYRKKFGKRAARAAQRELDAIRGLP